MLAASAPSVASDGDSAAVAAALAARPIVPAQHPAYRTKSLLEIAALAVACMAGNSRLAIGR